jgi:hypothetical protein
VAQRVIAPASFKADPGSKTRSNNVDDVITIALPVMSQSNVKKNRPQGQFQL